MVKVSILTAAYNAASTIKVAAASVLGQTYGGWEWIIASDDGEDYAAVIDRAGMLDPRIQFTSTGGVKRGECVARNKALAQAQGDVLAVLDADDAFVPEKLEKLLPRVLEHGAATSDIVIVNGADERQLPSLNRKFAAQVLSPCDYITANLHGYSLLMWDRRQVDLRWDESIALAPDMIHGLCAFNTLPGVWYEPAAMHKYFKHPSSVTNQDHIAARFVESYKAMLARAQANTLPVRNNDALQALKLFLPRIIDLEEQFLKEQDRDPTLGFYNFIARHRSAFYFW